MVYAPALTFPLIFASAARAGGSPFVQQITDVRKALDQKFGSFKRKTPNVPVTMTGIAFFDPIHGQEGVAPNGIELHPLLGISFQ
jgi:hypothetical protein